MPDDRIATEQQLEVLAVHHTLATTPGLRQEREHRDTEDRKQQLDRLRRQLVQWSTSHYGEPLTIAANRYGVSRRQVATC